MSGELEPDDAYEADEVIGPASPPDRARGSSQFELSMHEGPLPTPEAYIDAYLDAGREIIEIAKAHRVASTL